MSLDLAAETVPLHWAEGGQVLRLAGSRISIDLIVGYFNDGVSPEALVGPDYYPHLELADVYAVIAYYLRHRAEVDAYIEKRRIEADEIQRRIESDPDYQAFIARVLAGRRGGRVS
jgi:uncharacterized protein (DUF433 family)